MTGKIRPEIMKFAEHMEVIMRVHDDKKGDSWKTMRIIDLKNMMAKEWLEYTRFEHETELIDIANFCMMIWHRESEKKEAIS